MLTPEERAAGRRFKAERQAALDALNRARKPDLNVLAVWTVTRHMCRGASVGITLRTVTEFGNVTAAGVRFAFIWKEGRCSGCGRTARARKGKFRLLPTDHQGHDGQAGPHPGDP